MKGCLANQADLDPEWNLYIGKSFQVSLQPFFTWVSSDQLDILYVFMPGCMALQNGQMGLMDVVVMGEKHITLAFAIITHL